MTTRSSEPAGVLVIDKPQGVTSHDVVARMRRVLGTRKVGHAGTLDPMATGVLVLACGRGTRLLPYLQATHKAYTATIRLGWSTTTDDRTGEALAPPIAVTADAAALDAVLGGFTGLISQVPSAVSAVKVDGRRAYARVRAGEQVELAPRTVQIHALSRSSDLRPTAEGALDFDIDVVCSTGTYIRALARDIGAALGCGAHLTALRRTAVGPFLIADALPLPQPGATVGLLGLAQAATAVLPERQLSAADAQRAGYGQPVACPGEETSASVALLGPHRELVAVAQASEGLWRYRAVFVERR